MDSRTLLKPAHEGESWFPESEGDREAVREQLRRLLSSSVFMRSKGCSNLLAYIVTRALEGDAERLKERTLGAEVFGRAPDYDTATDHVVRSTAGEIRKRLAQYYLGATGSEIRIDIPPGSYIPRFIRPVVLATAPTHEVGQIDVPPAQFRERAVVVRPGPGRFGSRRVAIMVVAAAVILSAAVIGARMRSPGRALDRFWKPVLESPNPVLVCIGAWTQSGGVGQAVTAGGVAGQGLQTATAEAVYGSDRVFLDDAMALAKVAAWLQQNAKAYHMLPPSRVAFADLQTSPAVLIGFNNYWTTSLSGRLRFTEEREPGSNIKTLRDKKNPGRKDWSVDLSTPYDQPMTDYALVIRAMDPKTGQTVIGAAGLTHFGTLAAGEFLTDPALVRKLEAYRPNGGQGKNVAIVLSTEVIKGSPGAPKIVTVDFW